MEEEFTLSKQETHCIARMLQVGIYKTEKHTDGFHFGYVCDYCEYGNECYEAGYYFIMKIRTRLMEATGVYLGFLIPDNKENPFDYPLFKLPCEFTDEERLRCGIPPNTD